MVPPPHLPLLDILKALPSDAFPTIEIYCDGACSGNPGPGGWGTIVRYNTQEWEGQGGEPLTTNNRMEMMAALQALQFLPLRCHVTLTTDSMYLKDGITHWILNWKKNGWKTADKKPVKNKDLWEALDTLIAHHQVHWQWIRGHAGHEENERADSLARQGIVAQRMKSSLGLPLGQL